MRKAEDGPTRTFRTDASGWFPFDLPGDVPQGGEVGFQGARIPARPGRKARRATSPQSPVLAEPVRGRLTWSGRKLKAYALSASGKRMQRLPTQGDDSQGLALGTAQTMWYELVPSEDGGTSAMSSGMLSGRYGGSDLSGMIASLSAYHPFPTVDEREAWDGLPEEVREAAIAQGEKLLGYTWPALPAALYMDFARTGNRSRYEGQYFSRRDALKALVLAECVEGKGRFGDDIINGIWAICEESSWVIPAHNNRGGALGDQTTEWVDLFAGETGDLLAWMHYLMRSRLDAVDPLISERIRREVKSRILDPFLTQDEYWWMGIETKGRLNNWSPWCSSNVLASFLLLEPDPQRRTKAARKAMQIVDRWLAGYHPDGCCDEGPSYWTVAGASLLDCLELLRGASGGKIDVYDQPLVHEIGRYIYRAHISGDYFVDFADAPAKVHLPAGLVYRYGRRINDPEMRALGSWVYGRRGARTLLGGSLLRTLPNLFDSQGIGTPAKPPFVRDVWLEGTQVMVAREKEGSDRGLYLAAKGGHNNESHNHNDVGEFIVYLDGKPVLVDAGVGTYTAKTFSDQRYEIWTMQSAYHNLPTANGVQQHEGEEFKATNVSYRADDAGAEFSMDVAGTYPKSSGITSWRRTYRLHRGKGAYLEAVDDFELEKPSTDIMLSLLTPLTPEVSPRGVITLGAAEVTFDGKALTASVEDVPLDDDRLRSSWGGHMSRIVLKPKAATAKATWVTRIAKKARR